MKLKFLAAAAALICGTSAFAGINTSDNDAEIFFIVWDEAKATFVQDTGLTLGSLLGQSSTKNWSFNVGANFAAYASADGNLADFSQFEGTRWAMFAVDANNNFMFDGKDLNLLTTQTGGARPPLTSSTLSTTVSSMDTFTAIQAQNGLTNNVANQGDSLNLKGSEAHFMELGVGGGFGSFAGNAIGSGQTAVHFCSVNPLDDFGAAPCTSKNDLGLDMQASFDGQQFSVGVTAVPEPGTYAMLLAGMALVGFAARRRQRA